MAQRYPAPKYALGFGLGFDSDCLPFSTKEAVWKTSRQVYLLCRWKRHLAGFPHLGVVDRWQETPKCARVEH